MIGIVGFILVGLGCLALATGVVGRYLASASIGSGYMLLVSGVALLFDNRDENVDYLIISDIYCKAMFIEKSNLLNESGLTGNVNPVSSHTHNFLTFPGQAKPTRANLTPFIKTVPARSPTTREKLRILRRNTFM